MDQGIARRQVSEATPAAAVGPDGEPAGQGDKGDFEWLLTDFVRRVPGASHAIVVSADGLLLAGSRRLPADRADQLAAVASGLSSLAVGAARVFDGGRVAQTVIQMANGFLFSMAVSTGSSLVVLGAPSCDVGLVVYEMTLLVDRVGAQLTPGLRRRLTNAAGD